MYKIIRKIKLSIQLKIILIIHRITRNICLNKIYIFDTEQRRRTNYNTQIEKRKKIGLVVEEQYRLKIVDCPWMDSLIFFVHRLVAALFGTECVANELIVGKRCEKKREWKP